MSTHESPTPLSPERLAEIRGRVEARTPGVWNLEGLFGDDNAPYILRSHQVGRGLRVNALVADEIDKEADADLIAHAPQDLTDLLAEVERLKRFESIVSWRYGDTTDGRTREDMVEKAARAFYESTDCRVDPALRTNWGHLAEKSPDVAESYRRSMRAALDAALGTQEDT